MKMRMRAFWFLCLWSITAVVFADALAPQAMLDRTTSEVVKALKMRATEVEQDPAILHEIIEKVILPHVDFGYMSRWVVGRSLWKKASAEEQAEFRKAFKALLIRTYANVVREYADETITYFPLRGDISGKKRIQVTSSITQVNREPIDVVYRLILVSEQWKVYDIVIEGVSLLKGFQSQFYDTLRDGGIVGLTAEIEKHNQEHAAKLAAQKQAAMEKAAKDIGNAKKASAESDA